MFLWFEMMDNTIQSVSYENHSASSDDTSRQNGGRSTLFAFFGEKVCYTIARLFYKVKDFYP